MQLTNEFMGKKINKKKKLKNNVLKWLFSMQTGQTHFKMNNGADATVFTSCFALFILDLFDETGSISSKEKELWVEYFNSFQDKDSGFFIPENYKGELNTKTVYQLTSFCLSALDLLGASPANELIFINQWMRSESLYKYLLENGCFRGVQGSGNMAMFVGIFLTYQYKKNNDEIAAERMKDWFYFHDEHQNKKTGFWGNALSKRYYSGFQNSFHQFEIYNYWNKEVFMNNHIVDTVLNLQDPDGHFAAVPGGGGCMDYDAANILINLGFKKEYNKKKISLALSRLHKGIINSQNKDGGFCESRKHVSAFRNIFQEETIRFVFSGSNPYLWYFRLRKTASSTIKHKSVINTHWTNKGRRWNQSDLWNTWFRCLTLAEIENTIFSSSSDWNFQKCIGLGYF